MDFKPDTSARSPLGYQLGAYSANGDPRVAPPEILQGELWEIELLDRSGSPSRFFSGNLSWSEEFRKVGKAKVGEVVADFDRVIRTGVPEDLATSMYVLHKRASGFDVHPCVVQVDLRTGRPLSFVSWNRDKHLLWAWSDVWNLRERWTSTRDGAFEFLRGKLPENLTAPADQSAWREIDRAAGALVREGSCANRHELLEQLCIVRNELRQIDDHGFSIQRPSETILRFEGGKYSNGFDHRSAPARIAAAREVWWGQAADRLPRIQKFIADRLEERRAHFERKFGKGELDAYPRTRSERVRAHFGSDHRGTETVDPDAQSLLRTTCPPGQSVVQQPVRDTVADHPHGLGGTTVAAAVVAAAVAFPTGVTDEAEEAKTEISENEPSKTFHENRSGLVSLAARGLFEVGRRTAAAIRELECVAAANAERAAVLQRTLREIAVGERPTAPTCREPGDQQPPPVFKPACDPLPGAHCGDGEPKYRYGEYVHFRTASAPVGLSGVAPNVGGVPNNATRDRGERLIEQMTQIEEAHDRDRS